MRFLPVLEILQTNVLNVIYYGQTLLCMVMCGLRWVARACPCALALLTLPRNERFSHLSWIFIFSIRINWCCYTENHGYMDLLAVEKGLMYL